MEKRKAACLVRRGRPAGNAGERRNGTAKSARHGGSRGAADGTKKGERKMKVLLSTERLTITEMTMDMAMDVHRNSLDEDTRRFVPDEVFETPEEAQETVAFLMEQYGSAEGPQVYAMIRKDNGENIGYVQLVPVGEGKWEIGYHVAKPHTGKGYATEAVKAFLPVIAGRVGITEVYGIRLLENAASGRVLEKCGFRVFFTGEGPYHDGVYKISRSLWKV